MRTLTQFVFGSRTQNGPTSWVKSLFVFTLISFSFAFELTAAEPGGSTCAGLSFSSKLVKKGDFKGYGRIEWNVEGGLALVPERNVVWLFKISDSSVIPVFETAGTIIDAAFVSESRFGVVVLSGTAASLEVCNVEKTDTCERRSIKGRPIRLVVGSKGAFVETRQGKKIKLIEAGDNGQASFKNRDRIDARLRSLRSRTQMRSKDVSKADKNELWISRREFVKDDDYRLQVAKKRKIRRNGKVESREVSTRASIDSEGKWIIQSRYVDNGHQILAGQLVVSNTLNEIECKLSTPEGSIPERPSFSPDGKHVLWIDSVQSALYLSKFSDK